jgi:Na+-transporting methylmalonyl-CoA/oxaloacetate decarboxylase gamma subunit
MLVQMLTERVANGGSYNLTFGESLTMAGIGMLVVFMELIILAVIIMLMGKVVSSIAGKKGNAAPAAKAAPAAAPVKAAAPAAAVRTLVAGYNVLKPVLALCGVDEPTAAMVMAITADKLGTQPSELSFRAIRAIELPEDLGGLKPEEAAELVSKCATENGFTLDTVTIKSIKAC